MSFGLYKVTSKKNTFITLGNRENIRKCLILGLEWCIWEILSIDRDILWIKSLDGKLCLKEEVWLERLREGWFRILAKMVQMRNKVGDLMIFLLPLNSILSSSPIYPTYPLTLIYETRVIRKKKLKSRVTRWHLYIFTCMKWMLRFHPVVFTRHMSTFCCLCRIHQLN